jgi:hypothetical protein
MGETTLTEENISFFFVTKEVTFEETKSTDKYAIIEATVMELEKPSEGGGVKKSRIYQFEEGEAIAKSLIGKPVYYGTNPFGLHDNPLVTGKKVDPVGIVEFAEVVGKKIKAKIKIISASIIETLKQGTKYLFSVGGNAVKETIKKIGDKIIHVLSGARCNHLQIVDVGTPVGFPNAKMEKLIEIQETIMTCEGGVCGSCSHPVCDGSCKLTQKGKSHISQLDIVSSVIVEIE